MPLASNLSTGASSGRRLHGLDHLRALAIILVFLYHYRLFGHPPQMDAIGSFGCNPTMFPA